MSLPVLATLLCLFHCSLWHLLSSLVVSKLFLVRFMLFRVSVAYLGFWFPQGFHFSHLLLLILKRFSGFGGLSMSIFFIILVCFGFCDVFYASIFVLLDMDGVVPTPWMLVGC